MNSEEKEEKIIIYTDGSSRGNPGPGGLGTIITFKQKERIIAEGYRKTTNNRMELLAVIRGLQALKSNKYKIEIVSDSKYVVDAIEKKWIYKWLKKGFIKKKNVDLWKAYLVVAKPYDIILRWVKGHDGHPKNELCDKLAVKAATGDNLRVDKGYEDSIIQ